MRPGNLARVVRRDEEETLGAEARRQHDVVDVRVLEPGVHLAMLRLQPERLDPGAQREVAGQLVQTRARAASRPIPGVPLDGGEPDGEPELPECQTSPCRQMKIRLLHVVAQANEGGCEQRLDEPETACTVLLQLREAMGVA